MAPRALICVEVTSDYIYEVDMERDSDKGQDMF